MMNWIAGGVALAGLYILYRIYKDVQSLKSKPAKRAYKKKPVEGREKVYVLCNPSFRAGVFKVGLTTRDVTVRMRELFTTGVPTPFVKCMELETDNCKALESSLHKSFQSKRINGKREFFELTEADLAWISNGASTGGYSVSFTDVVACRNAIAGPAATN